MSQTYQDKEYIVVDGGSTDGTLDIIGRYESKIDHWISEPDEGIADAMNKGLAMATGDYILFLHSDDYLLNSEILKHVSLNFHKKFDIYIYQVVFDYFGNRRISKNRHLDWHTNFKMGSCHQGQLFSRSVFEKLGPFDKNFKINMDYDFILRAYRAGATSISIDRPISVMRLIGVSSRQDWPGLRARFLEERVTHLKNCPNSYMYLLYKLYWSLYLPYRKIYCFIKSLFSSTEVHINKT